MNNSWTTRRGLIRAGRLTRQASWVLLLAIVLGVSAASADVDLQVEPTPADTVSLDSLVTADSLTTPMRPPEATPMLRAVPEPFVSPNPAMAPDDPSRTYLAIRGHGRPNPVTAVWQGAKNYVSDAIYIYTAPLRMSGENIVNLGLVTSIGLLLYTFDDEVYQGFQRSRGDPTYNSVVIETGGFFEPLGLMAETTPYLQGAAIAGWVFDIPLLRTIPGEIMESNSIVGMARQPIERAVGRPRPSSGQGPRVFNVKNGDSFPSGHASVICETAAILSHHAKHPVARSAIWAAAGTVLLQRVDEPGHNHWPADVWFGAALGTWAGYTVAKRNEERRHGLSQKKWYDIIHRPDPRPELTVLPVVSPEFTGLTLRARF